MAIVSQNSFVLVFMGYRTTIAQYVAKGVLHRCACVKLSAKGGVTHPFGQLYLPEKASRDIGYRSDSIAISRDMGLLSLNQRPENPIKIRKYQGVLQGVACTGVQVLREKRLFSLHEKRVRRTAKMK